MNFLDLFAQRLREKREQKKITQRELMPIKATPPPAISCFIPN